MMNAILNHLLGISTASLRADLARVESTWPPATHHLLIHHDSRDTIFVYGGIEYKAYVPKRYYAWKVKFIEWDGDRSKIPALSIYDI